MVKQNIYRLIQYCHCRKLLTFSVCRGSGLAGSSRGWNQTRGPGPGPDPPRNWDWVCSAGLLPGPDMNPQVFGQVGTRPQFHFMISTMLAEIQFWGCDRIVTC